MGDDNPVVCMLSDAKFREREATLLAQFKVATTGTRELHDGYAFQVPGEEKWLSLVAKLMAAERECCPFMTFEVRAEPKMGPLSVRITGPEGTKDFLKSILL
jgi:hypothetical protein